VLPIRTDRSNFIFRNPNADIPDMTGERVEPGYIRSIWAPTDRERDDIVQGLNIELNIFAEPIPPVTLGLTYEGVALRMRVPVIVIERFRATTVGGTYACSPSLEQSSACRRDTRTSGARGSRSVS